MAVVGPYIYWANSEAPTSDVAVGNSIGRANLDGTGVNQSFITGADYPCGLASDGIYLYWGNQGSNYTGTTIGRAKLDGTGVNESFITGADGACGFAFTH